MKTKYLIFGILAAGVFASCSREEAAVSVNPGAPDGKISIGTTVLDPLTKAYFDDVTAPTKYILWEATDKFDFHSITLGKDEEGNDAEILETSSATPDKVSDDGKTAFFSKDAADFMIITYPAERVAVIDSVDNVKSDQYKPATKRIVRATVPGVQPLSSVLSPDLVPMTSAKLAISDAAKAFDKEAGTEFVTPVTLYPLAGIVKMNILGLPGVTSATVKKVAIMSEFAGARKDPSYGISGDQAFDLTLENGVPVLTTLSQYIGGQTDYKGDDDRLRIDLVSEEGVAYTAEAGIDVCFIVNNSSAGMKSIRVAVYMSDGAVYQKQFTLADNIGFSKSKVSKFALDFSDGADAKAATSAYAVEWSKGYIVYDKENEAYKIGEPDQVGLYFKFGSALGVEFYPSTDDYIYRLKPADANVVQQAEINGTMRTIGLVTPDGQTIANGSCYFFTNNAPSAGIVAAWRNRAYYEPKDGKIAVDTLRAHTEFQEKSVAASTDAFAAETDPCSYIKVGEGENKWRVPTLEEVNDLISNGAVGLEFLNSDGTFPTGSYDGKLKQAIYVDGENTLTFSAFGHVPEAYSSKGTVYKLQMLYSNKYSVRFWSSTKTAGKTTASAYNLTLSGAPTYTTKPSVTAYNVSATNAHTPDGLTYGDSLPVRCVRDK